MPKTKRSFRAVAVSVILASTVLAVPAVAAPPMPDATISVAGSGDARAAATPMFYGDTVSFDTTLDAKIGKKNMVTIHVSCVQGDTMVYNWYGQADFDFPLRDQNSTNWTWDGGAADCTASLRYFGTTLKLANPPTRFAVSSAS